MALISLNIKSVRNICEVAIKPTNGINLIIGKNGCGKSAFLEAIFLLGRGRSFRTPNIRDTINYDSKEFVVSGEVNCDDKNFSQIGIKVGGKKI